MSVLTPRAVAEPGSGSGSDAATASAGAGAGGGTPPQELPSEATSLIIGILSLLMDASDLSGAARVLRGAAAEAASEAGLRSGGVTIAGVALTTVLALAAARGTSSAAQNVAAWTETLSSVAALVDSLTRASESATLQAAALQLDAAPGKLDAARARLAGNAAAARALLPAAFRAASAIMSCSGVGGPAGAAALAASSAWADPLASVTSSAIRALHIASGGCGPPPAAAAAEAEAVVAATAAAAVDASMALSAVASLGSAAAAPLAAAATDAGPAPLHRLMLALQRLVNDGRMDVLRPALDVMLVLCSIDAAAVARAGGGSSGRPVSGIAALLTAVPSAADLVFRAFTDMFAASPSGDDVGAALELLARLAAADPRVAAAARSAGYVGHIRGALARFCVSDPDVPPSRGALRVMEGGTLLLAALVSAASDASGDTTAAERQRVASVDRALASRALAIIAADTHGAYIASAPCMTAVCTMIAALCQGGSDAPSDASVDPLVTAARAVVMDHNGRAMVVAAMSSPGATPELLAAGTRALSALGGGSTGAAMLVRLAAAAVRRSAALPPVAGLLPAQLEAALSGAVAPAGGAGDGGAAAAAAKLHGCSLATALGALEEATRDLAARLAGEPALTAQTYRFAFDAISAAVASATAARGTLVSHSPDAGAVATPAAVGVSAPARAVAAPRAPPTLGSAAAAVSTAAQNARLRSMSRARGGAAAAAAAPTSPGDAAPTITTRARAVSSVVQAAAALGDEEAAALSTACTAVVVAGLQGATRLAGVALIPNSRRVGAAAVGQNTAAAFAASHDSTSDELLRYGDATGTTSAVVVRTAVAAVDRLKEHGARDIRVVCLVAAPEGIERLRGIHPDVRIWTAAIDEGLNEQAFIVPGLGDAGDRAYGTK